MAFPAQDTWQTPPEPIASMLEAPKLPVVAFSPNSEWIVELSQSTLIPIAELTLPKVALAGIQINPDTWGPAKAGYYSAIAIRRREEKTARPVALPPTPRIRNLSWSKCGQYLSFTLTHTGIASVNEEKSSTEKGETGKSEIGKSETGKSETGKSGISLWVLDIESGDARSLTGPILNATNGSVVQWLPDNTLVCKVRTQEGPAPSAPALPVGPIIEENLGRVAPARTYTNLLENPHDEALLEYYLTAQLVRVTLTGEQTPLTDAGLFRSFSPSPNGQWLKVVTTHRPFSYQVPLGRFPRRTEILNLRGESVYTLADLPLAEEISINFDSVREGRRTSGWRADQPATLYWIEALDGGDADVESEYRDCVYTLAAPFTDEPSVFWKTALRYNSLVWGSDSVAIAYEAMYNTRQLRMWWLAPGEAADSASEKPAAKLLQERNFQDAYSSPGEPVTTRGEYGWQTLLLSSQGDIYLNGRGASAGGVYPFLDRFNLASGQKTRVWQSPEGTFSRVGRVLDAEAEQLIIRSQTKTEPGNYWLYDAQVTPATETPLTHFSDPLPWYKDIHKEIVRYTRADGLELSATLYLPPNYNLEQDGPLPTLLWVYPEEHKSRETASQVTNAENTFGRPSRASVMFLLTQGYALLSGPSMPIVGEDDTEPNDTYLEQLIDSATAAVNYLVERGVSQRDRLAIGGHSYGAFTTANLLAYTDLFAAGIARSGAYNRSLTPFGFQGEQRNYWDATDTYNRMSPFTSADKINYPLLLIHGAADNNSGTYPIQSERLYEAMKGLGGTVRFVSLPYEEHGYRSREAVGHVLWEMVQWLDTYLKGL
ncbi:MAG: prolyl oligopeptidase family serine peptidase [Cyanobacteria bacterium P01_A01_bin.116]